MTPSYRTGSWAGLVGPDGLALLSPDFAPGTVRGLWEAMSSRRPLHEWLEAVTAGGLSGLPDFALARTEEGRVRILVRGQVEVDVDGTVIRAEGMSTWREHVGPAPTALRISSPESGGEQWPVRSGVVMAAQVHNGGYDGEGLLGDDAGVGWSDVEGNGEGGDLPAPGGYEPGYDGDGPAPIGEEGGVGRSDVEGDGHIPVAAAGDQGEATVLPGDDIESGHVEPTAEQEGDHDGHTVMVSDLRAARAAGAPGPAATPSGASGPAAPARPVPVLRLSTGQRVQLDRIALIGRAPESSRFTGPVAPHLVTVPSAQQDISRTHLEATAEGDHVVFTDLHSTNGTVVILPGAEPRRLHPGESVPAGAGAVADLGDQITVTVEIPGHGDRPDGADGSGGL